jgi:uncharacterized coiled-coil DUF342 family protein
MTHIHRINDHEEPRPVSAAERIDALVSEIKSLHAKHDALHEKLQPLFETLAKHTQEPAPETIV